MGIRGGNCENGGTRENFLNYVRCWLANGLGTLLEIVKIFKIVKIVFAGGWIVGWVSHIMLKILKIVRLVTMVYAASWCVGWVPVVEMFKIVKILNTVIIVCAFGWIVDWA